MQLINTGCSAKRLNFTISESAFGQSWDLYSFFRIRDHILEPYKTAGKSVLFTVF
jgi:hypothetical protein